MINWLDINTKPRITIYELDKVEQEILEVQA